MCAAQFAFLLGGEFGRHHSRPVGRFLTFMRAAHFALLIGGEIGSHHLAAVGSFSPSSAFGLQLLGLSVNRGFFRGLRH